jgi:uncharacterized protein (TIGR03435 family)
MRDYASQTRSCFRRRILRAAGVITLAVPVILETVAGPRLRAQAPARTARPTSVRPAFEVASIKPSKSDEQGTYLRRQPGGLYRATNAQVRALIASAYLNEFPPKGGRIFGGPGWIDREHFDIEAKAEGNPSREEVNLMAQSLLEDRFKLVVHRETRQLPIYALVRSKAGRTGPQLVEHSDSSKCTDPAAGPPSAPHPGEAMPAFCGGFFMIPGAGALRESGNGITMDMMVQFLTQSLDRTVLDRTGLGGVFDFTLEFAPELGPAFQPGANATASDPSAPPSIFTAIQEQLGLKLEPRKGPVDVVVIDHVERPSEN